MINEIAKKETYFNSKQLLVILDNLALNDKFEKKKPLPKFSREEVDFLVNLIFKKPNNLVYVYLADFISTNYFDGRFFLSGSYMKKLKFFYNFFKCNGNATKAVIATGYSKKCAKQQAHRLMKELRSWVR